MKEGTGDSEIARGAGLTTHELKDATANDRPPGGHARVGVVCPRCHFRQFVEMDLDQWPLDAPAAAEIHKHLTQWMESHCPDHATWAAAVSKN